MHCFVFVICHKHCQLVEENAAGSSHDSEELIKSSQPKQPDPTAASNKVEEEVDGKLNKGVLRHSFRRRQVYLYP